MVRAQPLLEIGIEAQRCQVRVVDEAFPGKYSPEARIASLVGLRVVARRLPGYTLDPVDSHDEIPADDLPGLQHDGRVLGPIPDYSLSFAYRRTRCYRCVEKHGVVVGAVYLPVGGTVAFLVRGKICEALGLTSEPRPVVDARGLGADGLHLVAEAPADELPRRVRRYLYAGANLVSSVRNVRILIHVLTA